MRKIYLSMSAALVMVGGIFNQTSAQGECLSSGGCPYNPDAEQWPTGTVIINVTEFGFATTESYVGDRIVCQVNSGITYTWSFCPADGAVAGAGAEDAEFTLFDQSNSLLCYSNNFCGNQPKIEYTATYTGTVTLQFNVPGCQAIPGVNNTIMMKASQLVSVDEAPAVAASFDIYPNPANDFITINYASRSNENVMIQIISSEGRVVHSANQVSANGFVANIDVKQFAAGMYFAQLTTANGVMNKKFLVH
jgi:hypothetical protein